MARPPRDPSLLSWPWESAPSGSGGPSSAVGLTSLPIVNSHAAAMLAAMSSHGKQRSSLGGVGTFCTEVSSTERGHALGHNQSKQQYWHTTHRFREVQIRQTERD